MAGDNPDAESGSGDDEDALERQVRARTRELAALESTLPAQALEASRRRVQAMLGDARWARLTVPVQTMLATAEHVGFSLDLTADFSGPVIGVCASVEVLLHDQVIGPATAHDPRLGAECRTFGQAVHALRRAEVSSREPLDRAIRNRLATIGARPDAVHRLIPLLDAVNRRFRIPAAHRELVTDVTWRSAWTAIIGPDRVLALTIDALLGR